MVLIWAIRFNVKQVKQKPLKVCIILPFVDTLLIVRMRCVVIINY